MTDRALGLVYSASQPVEGELPFTDKEEILDWMKGYVNESVKAGVLKGYPDGSFQPNKTSTRAEAVVMIQRMLEEMEEGLNPDITVVAQYHKVADNEDKIVAEKETEKIQLQVVDHVIYASLNDLYAARKEIMKESGDKEVNNISESWWPIEQKVEVGVSGGNLLMIDDYQMGNVKYSRSNSPYHFYAPVRALYGELMIPVYDLECSHDDVYVHWQGEWDMEENTLTIPIIYVKPIFTGA